MAKVSAVQKNERRKKLVKSFAKKREVLLSKIRDKTISLDERFAYVVSLAELPRNSAKNRVRNRCGITGRPRGYHKKVGLCRNILRDFASRGLLPGVIKASW